MRTTTKLALSSLKTGKARSILTGIAIFLTTTLITVITFGCNSVIQSSKSHAAEYYGEHFGIFNHVSPEQIQTITLHSQFYDVGLQTYAAEGICKGYDINLYAADSMIRKLSHFQIESGSYPQAENEILAQRGFFEVQGYKNPDIGDKVTLSLRINGTGEILEKEFVISGFLPSSQSNELAKRYSACVSEDFIKENIPTESDRDTLLGFKIVNDENLNYDEMKTKINTLATELGLKDNQVSINNNYLGWILEPQTEVYVTGICIILIIMVVSALVIYNIFHVAIIQKIREYGRLKALGADRKQLKQMVRMEGFVLSVFTIPAGILSGLLILKIVLGILIDPNITVFSLPLIVPVALLTACTVLLSMHKPIKLAAKTSPVEAIRYEAGGRELSRKGRKNVTVFGLTMSNLSLHRKRTITTILTMGFSCILFVVVANVVGNMDAGRQTREDLEYGKFRIEIDYALDDKTYPENNLNEIQKTNPLDEDFIRQLMSIDGVTDVRTRKQVAFYETNKNTGENSYITIAVVNEDEFAWLVRNAERGVVDYQNTAAHDGVIYMWDYFMDDEYRIGDTFQGEILDGDRRIPFSAPILGSCGHSNDAEITMTESTFEKLNLNENMTSILFVDCSSQAEDAVRKELEQIVGGTEHMMMTTFQDSYRLISMSISFMRNACYSFLAILGIIGFMNMANTMITNILTRKREFGVMQAIGMSNRQLNYMLQLEGLVFTMGTIFIALSVGSVLGYYTFLFCRENGYIGLFEYHVPVLELGILVLGIIGMQVILAFVLSKNVKKESLVERIRYEE